MAQQRYLPFGGVRWRTGTLPTDRQYTGQRWDEDLGLYDYKARYYDPALGRFIQPDTVIPEPGNPQALNRYSYVLNNPLRYNDPSGHWLDTLIDIASIVYDVHDIATNGLNWENGLSLAADVVSLALPVVTGGGAMVHAAMHADDAVHVATHLDDAVRVVEHVDEATEALAHADDAAEVLLHGGDELAEASKAAETLAASSERPIVIGENMERVQRYAEEVNGLTINDFLPDEGWSEQFNREWIQQMREEGREIIDIGPDFRRRLDRYNRGLRPDSPFYNLERRALRGYERRYQVFERFGRFYGGVRGLPGEPFIP